MQIQAIGVGEAFDAGLGNNSFLLTAPGASRVLVDCGYQIPERLWAGGLHRGIDAVYLTHTHADHAFGMVPLLTRFWEERRRRPLAVIGHRGIEGYLRRILDLGYPRMRARLSFPVEFVPVRARQTLEWRGLRITCARSQHGVTNLSVRFEHRGRSCAFSGDGAITEDTARLYAPVDLLFHELFCVRREVPGHTNLPALRRLAATLAARRIVVSHHSRRYRAAVRRALGRLGARQANAAGEPIEWISAEPGQVLSV